LGNLIGVCRSTGRKPTETMGGAVIAMHRVEATPNA
jgi:hypothetical protein